MRPPPRPRRWRWCASLVEGHEAVARTARGMLDLADDADDQTYQPTC